MADDDQELNEDDLYDRFPAGTSDRSGPEDGFNTWVRINDAALFTEEALANPAIREFVDAPIAVTYAQFKSSHRETEYFLHKPHRAMTGDVSGIGGTVPGISAGKYEGDPPQTKIATFVINHERTLAKYITRSIVISDTPAKSDNATTADTGTAGQIIHKQPET
jgi:hypothetical protein